MARPAMRLRLAPTYPSRVIGTTGIDVTRSGGTTTIKQNWSGIAETVTAPDLEDYEFLMRNSGNELARVPADQIILPVLTWGTLAGKPTEFPPAAHTQAISTITNLQAALDAKAPAATVPLQFDTRAEAVAATIDTSVVLIRVDGYTTAADCAPVLYEKISTPSPVKAWHLQSADGAYWELRASPVSPKHVGALGNDSADDTTALQAWSDYAAAFSVKAVLDVGIYRVPTASITFASDCIVEGLGDLTVIKRTTDTASPLFLATSKDRVSFRDITFNNAASVTSTTSNTVATGSKSWTITAALNFAVSDSVMIISTASPANYMTGTVTAYSGTSITIDVTTAVGSGTIASWTLTKNSGDNVACRAISSTNVEMRRLKATGRWYVGFEHQNCDSGSVVDCEIRECINRPIYVYSTSGSADDISIRDNLVIGGGFTQYGINLNGSIAGSITNVTISGNFVEGTTFQAIEVGGNCTACVVNGNTVQNLGTGAVGILIQRANSLTPTRNTVAGNTVNGATTGIQLVDCFYNIVSGNTAVTTTTGILVQQTTGNSCIYNNITDNNISAYTSRGISFVAATASGLSACSCVGNLTIGSGGATVGIFGDSNTDRITYTGNITLNNASGNFSTATTNLATAGNISA